MKQYDYKTVSRTMLGDLHTPVSTYLKVRDIFPQSALMESSDYHGSENNRTFLAHIDECSSIGMTEITNHTTDICSAIYKSASRNKLPASETLVLITPCSGTASGI